jgi:outer membrane protein assembly factor BamA
VPFKSRQIFTAQGAFATGAFQIKHNAIFTNVLGLWDLELDTDVSAPNAVTNFFGFGNETEFDQQADEDYDLDKAIDYYRIRFKYINQRALLHANIGTHATFGIGHQFQAVNVEQDYDGEDRYFLDAVNVPDSASFFNWKAFEGAVVQFHYDTRDNPRLTTQGINWFTEFRAFAGLNGESENLASITSELSFFFSLRLPSRLTVATRFGGGHNFSSSEFYQAQILGGLRNLRGYRKTRFYGNSRFYNNTELRLKLGTLRNRIVPISVGVYGLNDLGRVWYEGEDSNKWHHGYGGGIWISPLNISVISLELAKSEEELLFNFRLGFLL